MSNAHRNSACTWLQQHWPANEIEHSQTRKETEIEHSQTTLKPYLIQHILAKTCTSTTPYLFQKTQKQNGFIRGTT